VHSSGNSIEKHFPTCLGSGLALLDYDGDGRLDLYCCSTCDLQADLPNRGPGNRLFRNLGGGRFEDVTERANVGFRGFNHGVSVGDVDDDGHPDLYLTNLGPNVLYRNNGDGTFRDATAGSGLECPLWSTGSAFLDYDGDGRLDLYVSNYGRWDPDGPRPFCGDAKSQTRSICPPDTIAPERHALYRNRGDGAFEDRTEAAGILRRDGRGLGVIASDLNGDGTIDLYVANDKCPNFLFLNRGDGTFEDAGESAGASYSRAGVAQGSMGVDAEDLDGDGRPELVVTNFRGEGVALYRNLGGRFVDIAETAGLVRDSKPYVGWGCALADFDGDGKPDLLAVNGHVDDNLPILGRDVPQAEPSTVWRQSGANRFSLVADPGPFFATPHIARGAAFGDLDDDGDIDVVVSLLDDRPAILLNESPRRHWITIDLEGKASNRSAVGASVTAWRDGRKVAFRQVKGGGSYLSANDPRILIGLGDSERLDRVEIAWPSGTRSILDAPAVDRTHRVVEPSPEPAPAAHASSPRGRR